MDSLTLDAALAAVCVVLGLAVWYREPAGQSSIAAPTVPIARSIRQLRRRHRRAVRAIVELARECLERHPDGSFETFTARETLRTYLPETLAAYFAVPRALRRVRGARPSADDELSRQLRLLLEGLERIQKGDADLAAARMAANGAFLTERFASADFPRPPNERRASLGELVEDIETALRRV